jgi:hypothetical protein
VLHVLELREQHGLRLIGSFISARTNSRCFERIDGLTGLRVGMRRVESVVRRSNAAWIAIDVERSCGGGEHGGRGDRRG